MGNGTDVYEWNAWYKAGQVDKENLKSIILNNLIGLKYIEIVY